MTGPVSNNGSFSNKTLAAKHVFVFILLCKLILFFSFNRPNWRVVLESQDSVKFISVLIMVLDEIANKEINVSFSNIDKER